MRTRIAIYFWVVSSLSWAADLSAQSVSNELWSHLQPAEELGELRAMDAAWEGTGAERTLRLKVTGTGKQKYAWATFPAPEVGWDLANRKAVRARFANRGTTPLETMLWAVGRRGWSATGDFATLAPGETREFSCDLRQTFPDGTPKLDPGRVGKIQIMVRQAAPGAVLDVSDLTATGEAPAWMRPSGRIEVPDMEDGEPAGGRRVRFQIGGDESTAIYAALFLPETWKKGGTSRYPVVVEYPGNIFLNSRCYSTGRPEQSVMGYGMSEGIAIWVSLPFIDRDEGIVVEDGFGNADDTAAYAVKMVEKICRDFGGDRKNVILTGFSRGSIACGFIGLRDETIAPLWKGIHGCQHYDGSQWHQSNLAGAVERATRFQGKAIFQTDNSREKYQPVVNATDPSVTWTWVSSGLGFHDTAMFLDDRPSTLKLREWYRELVGLN